MTDFDVSDDAEALVEDTDLPRRLKNEVYEAIEGRDVPTEKVDEIAQAVESRYLETRVDPLDPVGTVSAQSIGEPGTQMSVPADEEVIVRRDGETDVVEIGPFVDSLVESRESRSIDDHEVALAPEGIEVPSLGSDEQVRWKAVEEVSRHETPDELLRFELESGRSIRATKAHSFVTRRENGVVPVAGEKLDEGDWLPVVAALDTDEGTETVDLREYLPSEDYWFTSTLTDGGVEALPGGQDQIRNKRAALDAGELDERTAYPVGSSVGLPESFPLDAETGFFVGAWLAEGSLTEYYVSVSNVDSEFQNRIRSFAERFDLSVNEYENESGFATGYDIRVNGTILADFLRAACTEDGEKAVPGFAYGAADEFVRALLRGYFSGDGNVGSNSVRSSSTSDRLTAGIALLLSRAGIYSTLGRQDDSRTLRVPKKHVPRFADRIGMVGERGEELDELATDCDTDGPDATDQIPNFGDALEEVASDTGIPQRQINSATKRQRVGRTRLRSLVDEAREAGVDSDALATLERAVEGDVVWDCIDSVETVTSDHEYVYDLSVAGLETFTTAEGVVTHNTMNTFHYAGVAEIDVTQGLPRLIELVDARKTPDTPMMTVHLEDEYAVDRERAHEVVWSIEATRILALGDVSTNVADMIVRIDLNEDTLHERWPTVDDTAEIVEEIASTIESKLGVETSTMVGTDGSAIEFGPEDPSYRDLLQQVEELRDIVFKGIDEVSRVVIRKEEIDDEEIAEELDAEEEFVLYTEGSAFGDALKIEGVDASRTTCNNIHEIRSELGIEAAREAIIEETMNTLEEQGLDDVNIRHLMLVADIMTNRGTIESIGRHGISGNKQSVLARAAFEVTVNHLLDAAIHGEVDDLNGVTENVIVGKPIKLGTGDVNLRMGAKQTGESGGPADD
ncbi:DNA-directed RNA polymerase subunit A'' [Haloglomus halophilum]|uniref:DNA-directed RNA polymerase subunit A'' n=1 Tax=Haloglomus halophilum TaxID=2962672 RepID=UPI0020CA08A5|nr:DNA-directed RNA polymerase subunit A'' [Haloglomus halophilum]